METKEEQRKKPDSKYAVPALDKALDVLELLSDLAHPVSQAEIARNLGRNPSEIFRTLSALEARGYIRRTNGGRFRLTLKLFELSRGHSPYEELMRVALPVMRDLSDEVGETCHLTALRNGEIIVLAQNESPNPVRLSIAIGSNHSPLTTSSGRVLLSSMDEKDRNQFLSDYTDFDNRPEDVRQSFITRLRTVRERGYDIADGERFVGGLDVGVLIGSPDSRVKAALVVATLRSADGPDVDAIVKAAVAAGKAITENAGIAIGPKDKV